MAHGEMTTRIIDGTQYQLCMCDGCRRQWRDGINAKRRQAEESSRKLDAMWQAGQRDALVGSVGFQDEFNRYALLFDSYNDAAQSYAAWDAAHYNQHHKAS